MNADYLILDPSQIFSPSLLFYRAIIARNIARLIERVGNPERLRPHVKTHKTTQIVRMQRDAGITKQKCATIAEAEMLAQCDTPDIMLSYPVVGPNCGRFARLITKYPRSQFSCLVDHEIGVEQLSASLKRAGVHAEVLLDIDVGQHRTGVAVGVEARKLFESIARTPGLQPGGLHVYDGHNHQHPLDERHAAVQRLLTPVLEFRDLLAKAGLPVPRLVFGGTPTFPVFAATEIAGAECSPGTCVLHDFNYQQWFDDLREFTPAALLLTRVISRPTPTRVTFDLGYKAVSADQPPGKRCLLLDVPGEHVLHNEEHLVVETQAADRFKPGDVAYAIPAHVCPTVALHQFAYVIDQGRVVDRWEIAARDRILTV
jgi:D-serine deaminase-like pyridoxal phosphate-dependent protein